ncbi:MAG TPA: hypothetical protein VFK40_12415, partial [Nitrososphaeraceae archaeon]|nr:hypothetical protein [Nitrososphaeraceae archaeon]
TNYRAYMKRIEVSLGESKSPDGIEEEQWWKIVMKELNALSKECAKELKNEMNFKYIKPNRILAYEEAPPTRLWALSIVLNAWLGWIANEKGFHQNCWQKIDEAFNFGRRLSINKETP